MKGQKIGWLSLLALAAVLSACAPKVHHVATVSVVGAHATLGLIQDTEMLIVCGRTNAPAPPACVPQATHVEISKRLAQAFEWDAAVARTVRDWPQGAPPPANLGELLAKITEAINYVVGQIPPGAFRDKLLAQIGGVK